MHLSEADNRKYKAKAYYCLHLFLENFSSRCGKGNSEMRQNAQQCLDYILHEMKRAESELSSISKEKWQSNDINEGSWEQKVEEVILKLF